MLFGEFDVSFFFLKKARSNSDKRQPINHVAEVFVREEKERENMRRIERL
jgi:hypothetical protein